MGTKNQHHLSEEEAHRVAAQAIGDAGVIEYTAEGCRIATAIAQQAVDVHDPNQWWVSVYIPDDDALQHARSVVLIVKPAREDVIRAIIQEQTPT